MAETVERLAKATGERVGVTYCQKLEVCGTPSAYFVIDIAGTYTASGNSLDLAKLEADAMQRWTKSKETRLSEIEEEARKLGFYLHQLPHACCED